MDWHDLSCEGDGTRRRHRMLSHAELELSAANRTELHCQPAPRRLHFAATRRYHRLDGRTKEYIPRDCDESKGVNPSRRQAGQFLPLLCRSTNIVEVSTGVGWMSRRVIVDENVGPGTEVWEQFERAFGDQQCEYVFLAKTHCGIPDVEILDKLLRPGTVLLTGDCVLHTQAIKRGYRSYTLNQCGQLTRKRLPHVRTTPPLPKSVHSTLQVDYRHQPAPAGWPKWTMIPPSTDTKNRRTNTVTGKTHFLTHDGYS